MTTVHTFALSSGAFGTYKRLVEEVNAPDEAVRRASLHTVATSLRAPLLVSREMAMLSSVLSLDSVRC